MSSKLEAGSSKEEKGSKLEAGSSKEDDLQISKCADVQMSSKLEAGRKMIICGNLRIICEKFVDKKCTNFPINQWA